MQFLFSEYADTVPKIVLNMSSQLMNIDIGLRANLVITALCY